MYKYEFVSSSILHCTHSVHVFQEIEISNKKNFEALNVETKGKNIGNHAE